MIKEALQYIIGLQQPRVQEIDAQKYFFNKDWLTGAGGVTRWKFQRLLPLWST